MKVLAGCIDKESTTIGQSCFRAVLWSVLLSVVVYLGFIIWNGWGEVAAAVVEIGLAGIAVALLLSLVNYGIRFFRWQEYLKLMNTPVDWMKNIIIYIAGFSLTTTPGKAGEMLRGVLLKREGTPYSISFAVFISERLSDLLAIIILTLLGLTYYPEAQPLVAIMVLVVLSILLLISSGPLLGEVVERFNSHGYLSSIFGYLINIFSLARSCHSPVVLLWATLLSLIAWGAEGYAFFLVLDLMGVDIPLLLAMFIYAISLLAGVVSFMPGGLGGVEAAMIGLLVLNGVDDAQAVSATVVIRLTTLWFAVVLGALMLLLVDRRGMNN